MTTRQALKCKSKGQVRDGYWTKQDGTGWGARQKLIEVREAFKKKGEFFPYWGGVWAKSTLS